MNPTIFLKHLTEQAERIQRELALPCLTATCLLMAMAEHCAQKYQGLTPYDHGEFPPFEEERLRFLFKRVFRGSGTLLYRGFRANRAADTADFFKENTALLQKVLQERGGTLLSADLAFLAAVKALEPACRPSANPAFREDFSIADTLAMTDREIYDDVIAELGHLQQALQEKADRAKALRDWRPAAKFMEPEALEKAFYAALQVQKEQYGLLIPHFFGEEKPLRLTFGFWEGCWYVHDNGCALSCLRERGNFDAIFARIRKNLSVEEGRIIGAFSQPWGFFHYLQTLVFAAHADLYWAHLDEQGLHCDPDISFPQESEDFDFDALLRSLGEKITFGYDEQLGSTLFIGTRYSLNSHSVGFRFELSDEEVCIRDAFAHQLEGSILESFYWGHEDPEVCRADFEPYLNRFGATLSEKELSLKAPSENWIPALFRFFNLAVLCSELGRLIDLEEER